MAPPHCREAVSSNSLFLTVRPDSSRAEMGGERRAGRRGAAGLGGRASCPRWAGPAAPGPALSGAPRLLPSRLLPSQPPRAGRPFSVRGQCSHPAPLPGAHTLLRALREPQLSGLSLRVAILAAQSSWRARPRWGLCRPGFSSMRRGA